MKKTIFFSLLLAVLIFTCSCSSISETETLDSSISETETLDLFISEWIIHRGGPNIGISDIIGGLNFIITDEMVLSVKSNDEAIVYVRNGNILEPGNKFGKTTVEITLDGKVGILNVEVKRQIDYYFDKYQKDNATGYDKTGYLASTWLINNIAVFKNPSSVTVKDVYYIDGEVTPEHCNPSCFIMEISAQNGFGGYSTEYFKVTSYSIEEATIKSTFGAGPLYYGNDIIYFSGDTSGVNRAVREYIEENY